MCKEPTRQAVFHDERHIFCSVRSFLAHYQIFFFASLTPKNNWLTLRSLLIWESDHFSYA